MTGIPTDKVPLGRDGVKERQYKPKRHLCPECEGFGLIYIEPSVDKYWVNSSKGMTCLACKGTGWVEET